MEHKSWMRELEAICKLEPETRIFDDILEDILEYTFRKMNLMGMGWPPVSIWGGGTLGSKVIELLTNITITDIPSPSCTQTGVHEETLLEELREMTGALKLKEPVTEEDLICLLTVLIKEAQEETVMDSGIGVAPSLQGGRLGVPR